MRLNEIVPQYVAFRKSMGEDFTSAESLLKTFCRHVGKDIELADVEAEYVQAFLTGTGTLSGYWRRKYDTLRGLYRYAISRGFIDRSPLPSTAVRAPRFKPYIYTEDELRWLLNGIGTCLNPPRRLEPHTLRAILLLLYGAGLRIGEAVALTVAGGDRTYAVVAGRCNSKNPPARRCVMANSPRCGSWIRRFLLEYLVRERNLARNTQCSYRDTLALLMPFVAERAHKPIDQLDVVDVNAENVRQFLQHLEQARHCSLSTRNQRLAVIHALARFIAERSPEHIEWGGQIRAIPFKNGPKRSISYLEKSEMDALLAAPDRSCAQRARDHSLLLFLYNTGARADEAAQLRIGDLHVSQVQNREQSFVKIRGKGDKQRLCPLWANTVNQLLRLIEAPGSP